MLLLVEAAEADHWLQTAAVMAMVEQEGAEEEETGGHYRKTEEPHPPTPPNRCSHSRCPALRLRPDDVAGTLEVCA